MPVRMSQKAFYANSVAAGKIISPPAPPGRRPRIPARRRPPAHAPQGVFPFVKSYKSDAKPTNASGMTAEEPDKALAAGVTLAPSRGGRSGDGCAAPWPERVFEPLAAGTWVPRDGHARRCGTDAAEGEDGGEAFTGGKRRADGLG